MSYDDIISLPHHVSQRHSQMSMEERAAQFAPFAALVGFDDDIAETNRLTEEFVSLDENYLQELDEKLNYVRDNADKNLQIAVTYFVPDGKKEGGAYVTAHGCVKKIDDDRQLIVFDDRRRVSLPMVIALQIIV